MNSAKISIRILFENAAVADCGIPMEFWLELQLIPNSAISADYVYLYAGEWIEAPMYPMTQDKFVAMVMDEMEMTTPMYDEEEMMEEGYEAKWQKFLNEGEMDVVGVASSVLRDMPNLDVYIDSLKNDVRLNGAGDYYGYDSDDWEEDYNNYMADKMDM